MRKQGIASRSKWGALALVVMALVLGLAVPGPDTAQASGPGPHCGPTRAWNCVTPGCPDCPEYLFEGTVCEKNQYEKQTGRVCSPA
jgi:hypothetical protein